MQVERRTLTVPEAARLLGISRNSAYLAARNGQLPVVRIGKRFVVPRTAIEALLGERVNLGQGQAASEA